jgi:PAS domain S-box-containing protein
MMENLMTDLCNSNVIPEMQVKELLRIFAESTILAFTDIKGNIFYANDKFCEISKYRREELLGQNHRILKSGFHSKDFYSDLWKTISSGKIWTGEIKNRAKDGTFYWVFTTVIPFLNEHGKPYQYAAIRIDITERKNIEEGLNKALDELNHSRIEQEVYAKFVATLSHDLRTPLTGILLAAQLIQRNSEISRTIKALASKIVGNSKRVDTMIVDMLDLNQIANGSRLSLIIAECDAASVIKNTIDDLNSIYGNRFILKKSGNFSGYWSESGLKRIVENLCSNAIKYGAPDKPVIINLTENAGMLEFTVHNEGKPIPEDDINKLFNYLHQAPSAKFGTERGWGIGLSLVHGMVQAHGGNVKLKSSLGEGTTFFIQMPMDARPFQNNVVQAPKLDANESVLKH